MTQKTDAQYMLQNRRHPDESFEEYQKRRKVANAVVKQRLKGMQFYDSSTRVPYVKKRT